MAFKTKSTAERLAHTYEGATIFYHRLLYTRQSEILAQCTERGVLNGRQGDLLAVQDAVDGWDEGVHDADDHPLPVPSNGTEEERRQRIAQVVATFPNALIGQLATLSFADDPEAIKKSWEQRSAENSALLIGTPGSSLPVEPVDGSTLTTIAPSPVTPAG